MFRILTLLIVLTFNHTAFAWGAKGHKIVAQIARHCLSQNIIDSVQKHLGKNTFEEASVWMDEIKSDHTYDEMKAWHYVNVDKDKTYVKSSDPNVIEMIRAEMEILMNRKSPHRQNDKLDFDIKVLFHLVGDIHQPLHCGYSQDKGGNTIDVKFFDKQSNLHKVWDSELIDAAGITLENCLDVANEMPEKEKDKIRTLDIEEWAKESRELLPGVYSFDKKITQEYIDKNKLVIQKQLVRAGVRLAYIFHKSFSH